MAPMLFTGSISPPPRPANKGHATHLRSYFMNALRPLSPQIPDPERPSDQPAVRAVRERFCEDLVRRGLRGMWNHGWVIRLEYPVMEDAEQRAAGLERSVFDSEEVTLDASARVARFRERTIRFTPVEFRLLEALLDAAGQFLTREQLLSAVWGAEEPRSNIVDAYICRLRRKLGEGSVQTLHGVGYRMAAPGGLRREERTRRG